MAEKQLTTYEPIEPGRPPEGWSWLLKLALLVLVVWFVVNKAEHSPEIQQIIDFLEEAAGQGN